MWCFYYFWHKLLYCHKCYLCEDDTIHHFHYLLCSISFDFHFDLVWFHLLWFKFKIHWYYHSPSANLDSQVILLQIHKFYSLASGKTREKFILWYNLVIGENIKLLKFYWIYFGESKNIYDEKYDTRDWKCLYWIIFY